MNLGLDLLPLNRFASYRLRNENHDLREKNAQLKRQFQQQRDRANQLTVTLKTTRSRCSDLRKQLREAEERVNTQIQGEIFSRIGR